MPHRFANVGGALPAGLITRIHEVDAACEFDFAVRYFRAVNGVGAIGDVLAVDAPLGAALLEEAAEGDDRVGAHHNLPFHPIHQDASRPTEQITPDVAVNIVPSVNDFKIFPLA